MPTGAADIEINASSEAIFDLIHDYDRRLEWDPFLREARLLEGAGIAGVGATSRCVARWPAGGMAMETVYVSFNRPTVAAVKMTRGPWFLRSFAASLRQEPCTSHRTRVTYRYRFESRFRFFSWLIDPLVGKVFHRETTRRLSALKAFLEAD
jgi:hypothetical protein